MKNKILLFLMFFSLPLLAHATSYELSSAGQNTGIGTASPLATLGVGGNLSVGSSTYTNTAPPTNGVIIQGNVGIGSTTPGQALDVNGTIRTNGSVTIGSGQATVTGLSNGSVQVGGIYSTANIGIGTATPNGLVDATNGSSTANIVINTGLSNGYASLSLRQQEIEAGAVYVGGSPAATIIQNSVGGGLDFDGTTGITQFYISPAGNAGVGTLNPGENLDVQGTARMIGVVINNDGSAPTLPASMSLDVQGSLGLSAFGGNVGIGTTSTALNTAQLNINNLYHPSADLLDFYKYNSQTSPVSYIGPTGSPYFVEYFTKANGSVSFPDYSDVSVTDGMYFPANGSVALVTNNLARLNVVGANVGIGSAFPNARLDVEGTTQLASNPGAQLVVQGTLSNAQFTTPSFYVAANGNVGIGTTVPKAALDVEGSLTAFHAGGVCTNISNLGSCFLNGNLGYCCGAAGVCTTCCAC